MDTKNLSPAFFTSLAVLLFGALMLGLGSGFIAVLGWIIFLAGIGLNVFSTLVVIQKAKGGPLPELIARADSSTHSDAVHGGTRNIDEDDEPRDAAEETVAARRAVEPEPETQIQDIVVPENHEEAHDEIFKPARTRNR